MTALPPEPRLGAVSLPRAWSSMRELRQARGLSQARLAELSGVSERTVRAIEGGSVGRPHHESLRRIAAVLAYGAGHQRRLVASWTGLRPERSAAELGIPDAERLFHRVNLRDDEEGGLRTAGTAEVVIGSNGLPLHCRYLHVHDAMNPAGEPVIWKFMGGMDFALPSIRFEVTTGGVLDDFLVHGEVGALAIRPDPATAQKAPFVIGYTLDFRAAEPLGGDVSNEWMIGSFTRHELWVLVVRFSDRMPERAWSVRGETAATAQRVQPLPIGPDRSVQLVLRDVIGVFGIQWDWGDDAASPEGAT